MSLARGKFGIEYNPRPMEPESSGFGWIVAIVAVAALISLSWVIVKRVRGTRSAKTEEVARAKVESVDAKTVPKQSAAAKETRPPVASDADIARRPPMVRNRLLRLQEAEKRRDIEMAVTTIESIRALPGSPAADIDDALARRLGTLNIRRLFEVRCAQWVKQVKVGRGSSASRIAAENGSTLASLLRLNGGDVRTVRAGEMLYVMDHPRFNLVLHRRTRIADLSLNGKFFKRYDLHGAVKARQGAYEVPERKKMLWEGIGSVFSQKDREELEMLLPKGASIFVAEF